MRSYKLIWRVFSIACICMWNLSAQATLVRPLNLHELSTQADRILKGVVTDITTEYDADESGRMVTYYTLEVREWLKGTSTQATLVYKQVAQGQYTRPDGVMVNQQFFFPTLKLGHTYVLFLPEAHPKTGLMAPLGLWQGVLEVQINGSAESIPALKSRAKLLTGNLNDQVSGQAYLKSQQSVLQTDQSYQTFRDLIRGQVGE